MQSPDPVPVRGPEHGTSIIHTSKETPTNGGSPSVSGQSGSARAPSSRSAAPPQPPSSSVSPNTQAIRPDPPAGQDPLGPTLRNLLSASGFFSLSSKLGATLRQSAGGDLLASLLRSLVAFASRPLSKGSSIASQGAYSPLRALIALALEAKGLLPFMGQNASITWRSFYRNPASIRSSGAGRTPSSRLGEGETASADALKEGSRLLDALDGLITGLLGPFDGEESPGRRDREKQHGKNSDAGAGEPDTAEEVSPVSLAQDIARFNRTPLPDGKRWFILPFESVDTGNELSAVFRVLVDRPGPDGKEALLSIAAEIRAGGLLWSLRLPRALCPQAPLLVSCDDARLLKESSCVAAAQALATALDLELVLFEGQRGIWPDEWGPALGPTDIHA